MCRGKLIASSSASAGTVMLSRSGVKIEKITKNNLRLRVLEEEGGGVFSFSDSFCDLSLVRVEVLFLLAGLYLYTWFRLFGLIFHLGLKLAVD